MRWSVTAIRKGMKHTDGSNCIANTLATPNISLCSQRLNIIGVIMQ